MVAGMSLMLPALGRRAWADDAQPLKLTVAQGSAGLAYGPIYVALAKGYFADEKLAPDMQIIVGAPSIMAALTGGSIDIGLPGTNGGILSAARGQPVVTIGNVTTGALTTMIFSKAYADKKGITATSPDAQKIAALRGARIVAVQPGSLTQVVIEFFLRSNGLDPTSDVQLVPLRDEGAMLAALRGGQVDALMFGPPLPNRAIADGYGVMGFPMGDIPSLKDLSWTSMVVSRSWLASHEDVAVRFLRAIWRADQLIRTNEPEAREAAQGFFKNMDPVLFDGAWKSALTNFPTTPVITQANVAAVVKLINVGNDNPIDPKFDQVASDKYAEMARPK